MRLTSYIVGILVVVIALAFPVAPYPGAPLCKDHDNNTFHTLWNAVGCYYDHEHGTNPFTQEVMAAFPGLDLWQLLGGVGVGHTNPSSPHENTDKHGGFKWNVQLVHPQGCKPFESALTGVNGSVIQYHFFGDANEELEGSIHSAAALLRQCRPDNPTDFGYVYLVQHVNYGQRITPYQGTLIPYPNNFQPTYNPGFGPYWSIDCVHPTNTSCRVSLEFIKNRNAASATTATTKRTGSGARPENSTFFQLLVRSRDNYQVFDRNDMEYPFTYRWICGDTTYDPLGCKYNNTTTQVHEIAGKVPPEWDNLAGFDTNPAVGRVSGVGYTTRFGTLQLSCTESGVDCHPVVLVDAFTGTFGSVLVWTNNKPPVGEQNVVPYLPSRNIFFNGVPSGWVGPKN